MLAMLLDARPRGHGKPPQGRIRHGVVSPSRHGRASRWTASGNVRRYDWTASSGSVVGNDPIGFKDPSGLDKICNLDSEGNETACTELPNDDITVTGEEPDDGITASDVGRFIGGAALELAPGGAAVDCMFVSKCDTTDKLLAVVDLVPGLGKLGKLRKLRKFGRACGCVVAGTLVSTPSGLVAIEKLRVGDMVLAYDVTTDNVAPRLVLNLIKTKPKPTYDVVLRAASGEMARFEATDDHPWLSVSKKWRNTAKLVLGDWLIAADGERFEVVEVGLTGEVEVAYTLTVDDLHTYVMGEAELVVHNSCVADARKAFRTDRNFRSYFHKWKQDSGLAGDGAGQRNSDLSDSEMLEAYEDWIADGKPSR